MRKKLGRTIPLLLLSAVLLLTSLFAFFPVKTLASIRPGDIRNNNFRYKVTKTTSNGDDTITIEGYSKASSGAVNQTWVASKLEGNNIVFTPISTSNGTDAVSFKIYVNKSNYAKGVVYTIDGEKMSGQSDLAIENSDAVKNRTDLSTGNPVNTTNTAATDKADTNDEAEQDSCDVQINNPLSWIICPVMQLAEGAVNMFATRANDALCFEVAKNAATSSDCEARKSDKTPPPKDSETPLYQAWANMRNIANVLFVIALLVIVISQLVIGKM